jgi:hypothetical protein
MIVNLSINYAIKFLKAIGRLAWFRATTFNPLDPAIIHHIANGSPSLWDRMEHP